VVCRLGEDLVQHDQEMEIDLKVNTHAILVHIYSTIHSPGASDQSGTQSNSSDALLRRTASLDSDAK
jgi:hypothetical protein